MTQIADVTPGLTLSNDLIWWTRSRLQNSDISHPPERNSAIAINCAAFRVKVRVFPSPECESWNRRLGNYRVQSCLKACLRFNYKPNLLLIDSTLTSVESCQLREDLGLNSVTDSVSSEMLPKIRCDAAKFRQSHARVDSINYDRMCKSPGDLDRDVKVLVQRQSVEHSLPGASDDELMRKGFGRVHLITRPVVDRRDYSSAFTLRADDGLRLAGVEQLFPSRLSENDHCYATESSTAFVSSALVAVMSRHDFGYFCPRSKQNSCAV